MELPLKNNCFVTSIALVGLKHLGPESMTYEPEILRDAFESQFGMQKMSQKMFDKLNCGYMLVSTDAFVSTIEGFLTATAVMNNLVFEEDEIPFCTLENCVQKSSNTSEKQVNSTVFQNFLNGLLSQIRAMVLSLILRVMFRFSRCTKPDNKTTSVI